MYRIKRLFPHRMYVQTYPSRYFSLAMGLWGARIGGFLLEVWRCDRLPRSHSGRRSGLHRITSLKLAGCISELQWFKSLSMLLFAWLKNGKANTHARENVTSQVLVWFLMHKEVRLPTTSQSPQLLHMDAIVKIAWGNGKPTEHQRAHDSLTCVFPRQVTAWLLWQCCALEPWPGHWAAFGQDMVRCVLIATLACRRGWQGAGSCSHGTCLKGSS